MKLVNTIACCILLAACGHKRSDRYAVTGNIKGLTDSMVYLRWQSGDSAVSDSAVVKAGRFHFEGQLAEPVQAYLMTKQQAVPFYLDHADIRIDGNVDSLDKPRITGSAIQDLADSLEASLRANTDLRDSTYEEYGMADKSGDTAKLAAVEAKLDSLGKCRDQAIEAFIRSHPASPISLYQIQSMTYSASYHELEPLFEGLDTTLRSSAFGQYLGKYLGIMKRRDIGASIMDFTQNDLQGHAVHFADYRKGRYVLLDFWASWCGPCRAENPNVLKAYDRFKSRDFAILGVSLDEDGAKWREAVASDGMPWTEVSDLKGWKNAVAQQYGIQGIPANFLVDTSGIIVATNLRGTALEKKLAEVLPR